MDDHISAAHSSEMLVHTRMPLSCHSPDHHNQNTECYFDFQYDTEYVPTRLNSTYVWTVEGLQEDSAAVLILSVPSTTVENCALLGYYAASRGNFLPTFQDNLSMVKLSHVGPWISTGLW